MSLKGAHVTALKLKRTKEKRGIFEARSLDQETSYAHSIEVGILGFDLFCIARRLMPYTDLMRDLVAGHV